MIVLGRTFDKHLCNVCSVLQRMREAGLHLKSSFFKSEMQYLWGTLSPMTVYCISSIKRPGVYFFGVRFTRRLNGAGVSFSVLVP